jgi:hypothetical protein
LSKALGGVSQYFSVRQGYSIPDVHILHAHDDIVVIAQERAVEVHNIVRVALMHNVKLAHNAAPDFLLGLDMYDLFKN